MARFERETLGEVERHCGPLIDRRLLDFGAGTGTITPSLAVRGSEVVAFDISAPALDVARLRLHEHGLSHAVTVLEAPSFAEVANEAGQFDVVLMHAVFEHVPLSIPGLRARVLLQAFDALAPGGFLVITESPNRLWPRDIYCTGQWFLPWTKGGSRWAYGRAIAAGAHRDPEGRGPITLEERGAWGFTYWSVQRYLVNRRHEVVNLQPGHDRWVRYDRALGRRRRAFETAAYVTLTKGARVPIVAVAPMLSPLIIRKPA
jgi:SAM-dependent methyltransferase